MFGIQPLLVHTMAGVHLDGPHNYDHLLIN